MNEAISKWGRPDFNVRREKNFKGTLPFVGSMLSILEKKPYIKKELCVSCGICIEACPLDEKAIFFKKGKPAYNHRKCIKCYCCQEMCPKKAIDVKESFISKIAQHNWKI